MEKKWLTLHLAVVKCGKSFIKLIIENRNGTSSIGYFRRANIADNARIPFLEVARACNVSGAAIHQRIQKLTNLGILKGSEYVIDPEKIGYETCAYIGIYLKDPATFDAVTKALEAIPEIVECHFTTGKYDMFIKLYARNNHHLLSIIHDKLQPLGLSRTETLISFHEAIKRQMPIVVEDEEE